MKKVCSFFAAVIIGIFILTTAEPQSVFAAETLGSVPVKTKAIGSNPAKSSFFRSSQAANSTIKKTKKKPTPTTPAVPKKRLPKKVVVKKPNLIFQP